MFPETNLPINKLYYLDYFENNFSKKLQSNVLDFGCGDGEIVKAARSKGYNFFGCETFYDEIKNNPISDEHIQLVTSDGILPYPDNFFDYIYSNQVFEHVKNLSQVLSELNRVLKPNGSMLHYFPVKEYFIEGHYGIPFQHRLNQKTEFSKFYIRLFYKLGFGYNKEGVELNEWIFNAINFVDIHCFYRSFNEINNLFSKDFASKIDSKKKILWHLKKKKYRMTKFFFEYIPSFFITLIQKRRGSLLFVLTKK